jgi:hypothetical protein
MGHVAAVGKFSKDSNVVKKASDDAMYFNALQVVL